MKIFTIILSLFALAMIVFNALRIDLNAPFQDESMIAIITILASLCAIILLQILRISKRIEKLNKLKK